MQTYVLGCANLGPLRTYFYNCSTYIVELLPVSFWKVRNNWCQSYNSTIIEIGAQKSQSGPIAWPKKYAYVIYKHPLIPKKLQNFDHINCIFKTIVWNRLLDDFDNLFVVLGWINKVHSSLWCTKSFIRINYSS